MKIAGHTMGTPELNLEEAASLFSNIGMDAIEIIFQDDYHCGFNWSSTDREINAYKEYVSNLGMEVSCIVAYASDFNCLEQKKREDAMNEVKKCIEIADLLSSKYIRIYGGKFLTGDDHFGEKREKLIDSMRFLAEYAGKSGISLIIENHFNTMTTGPLITIDIVNEINKKNVGILYDQANISFLSGEEYEECIRIQKSKISYVHVKDFIFKDVSKKFYAGSVSHVNESERAVSSRIVGDGVLPWPDILNELYKIGYDGFLSLEYERRWHPNDLPPAEIGMKKSFDYISNILKRLSI